MKNVLALVRNGSSRVTTHQAVVRLVIKLGKNGKFGTDLRKIGFWTRNDLERHLGIW